MDPASSSGCSNSHKYMTLQEPSFQSYSLPPSGGKNINSILEKPTATQLARKFSDLMEVKGSLSHSQDPVPTLHQINLVDAPFFFCQCYNSLLVPAHSILHLHSFLFLPTIFQ